MENKSRMPLCARWLVVALWMAIIYWFSDQPNSSEVTARLFYDHNFLMRKLAHVTEFAILFSLCRCAIAATLTSAPDLNAPAMRFSKQSAWALIISISYACFDEWHQSVVPGRSSSTVDVGIDSIGPILVIALMALSKSIAAFRSRATS